MQYGVIMAGGSGTRLWPLSRGDRPKQLLPVVRGKSLLQLSYERLRGLLPPERIFVCTGEPTAHAVLENLPELPKENLLGEPEGRDTANAVGFPAAVLLKRDPRRGHGRRHRRPRHRAGRRSSRRRSAPRSTSSSSSPTRWSRSASSPPTATRAWATSTAASRSAPRSGGDRRLPRPGVQGKARQADRRPLRRVRPLLLEQRHVRLAVRHRAERAGRAPPRRLPRPDADRRGLGHAAAASRC